MSATNKTTYYDLPIFIGTDVPSWLGDWNSAMNAIDTAIQGVNSKAQSATSTANSASSELSTTNETVSAMNAELETVKKAVMNYDAILDFNMLNTAAANNNFDWCNRFIAQNTNKTLSTMWVYAKFKSVLSNPVVYNYTDSNGTFSWYDIFTIEDNCFNLTQSSQPSATNCMSIGPCTWKYTPKSQQYDKVLFRDIKGWFDGATTHIGIKFYNSDLTHIVDSYLGINASVFLSGSVYNPTTPEE